MTDTLVEAKDLSRTFGDGAARVVALTHASCSIERGDRIALIGPSGSGKSTLLHLLAGLDEPSGGLLRWPALGDRASLRPSKVAFVFQAESLLAPLTVLENVEVPCLLAGADPARARTEAAATLDVLDLSHISGKLPEEISGGQAQRVAVARSLMTHPDIIFADEPTGQLDHASAARLIEQLEDYLKGTGTAVVFATHDPYVAGKMKTHWRIDHGVLQ